MPPLNPKILLHMLYLAFQGTKMHFFKPWKAHLRDVSALLVFLAPVPEPKSDQPQMHYPRPAKRMWPWFQQIWNSLPFLNPKFVLQMLYFQGAPNAFCKAWKMHLGAASALLVFLAPFLELRSSSRRFRPTPNAVSEAC